MLIRILNSSCCYALFSICINAFDYTRKFILRMIYSLLFTNVIPLCNSCNILISARAITSLRQDLLSLLNEMIMRSHAFTTLVPKHYSRLPNSLLRGATQLYFSHYYAYTFTFLASQTV